MATLSPELIFAVVGAGGKMGTRIRRNLAKLPNSLQLIEQSSDRWETIRADGQDVTDALDPVSTADFVILAVPDSLIERVSKDVVPLMKPDATLILLDPAAAHAGVLAKRDDCTFVVTHPCHPPMFMEQEGTEAKADFFGGVAAKQDIVVALESGREKRYGQAEELCRQMFAPVMEAHRITVHQMAMLEPAAAEVTIACAATLMRGALDEAVRRGVPEKAARSFLLGHTKIPLAIVFDQTDFPFSDAAQVAIEVGFEKVIKPTWQEVFDDDVLDDTIKRMIGVKK